MNRWPPVTTMLQVASKGDFSEVCSCIADCGSLMRFDPKLKPDQTEIYLGYSYDDVVHLSTMISLDGFARYEQIVSIDIWYSVYVFDISPMYALPNLKSLKASVSVHEWFTVQKAKFRQELFLRCSKPAGCDMSVRTEMAITLGKKFTYVNCGVNRVNPPPGILVVEGWNINPRSCSKKAVIIGSAKYPHSKIYPNRKEFEIESGMDFWEYIKCKPTALTLPEATDVESIVLRPNTFMGALKSDKFLKFEIVGDRAVDWPRDKPLMIMGGGFKTARYSFSLGHIAHCDWLTEIRLGSEIDATDTCCLESLPNLEAVFYTVRADNWYVHPKLDCRIVVKIRRPHAQSCLDLSALKRSDTIICSAKVKYVLLPSARKIEADTKELVGGKIKHGDVTYEDRGALEDELGQSIWELIGSPHPSMSRAKNPYKLDRLN